MKTVCVSTILLCLCCCSFTSCTHKTDNVFDQLYYEVKSVSKGRESVLTSGTESAWVDYDLGEFVSVQIPDLDMSLDFDDDSLYILFFNHDKVEKWDLSYCVLYRYDKEDKKLYGEESFDYLEKNFLSYYFRWFKDTDFDNAYSLNELGNYTFTYQESVHYN